MPRRLLTAALIFASAALGVGCLGGGGQAPSADDDGGRACGLLTRDEVESFVGEPVREGSPGELVEPVDDVCRFGDADPDEPGHIVSLRLAPAGTVERPQPGAEDRVYEAPSLGDDAVGIQSAGGGVRVLFESGDVLVDLAYDVVPLDAMEDDAIDRLIRLAGRIRDRLERS